MKNKENIPLDYKMKALYLYTAQNTYVQPSLTSFPPKLFSVASFFEHCKCCRRI